MIDSLDSTDTASPTELDASRIGSFANRLVADYTAGMVTLMVDLGHRTGLFEAAAQLGPASSSDLASRAGCDERYTREWLGAVVTAGIVDYDSSAETYELPAEHAVCLTGQTSMNMANTAGMVAHLGRNLRELTDVFREGGGLPYDVFRPEFTDLMDAENRFRYDECLTTNYVPLAAGLVDQLAAGIRVADVGCGTGHCINLMAAAFPASEFFGYDLGEDAIARAQAEAASLRLGNAHFEVLDVVQLPPDPGFDLICAFDAIHDQVDPAAVLARVNAALRENGTFFMLDVRAHTALQDNIGNPFAPMLYAISTMHCMTVSLAHGGAGLGTVWGEETACRMVTEAGLSSIEVHELDGDPLNSVYVCRRPSVACP